MPVFTTAVRCFCEVARHGSMRRAAAHLHLTASAVNRQVLALERELDVGLFERMPRGMRLTAAGEVMLHALRRQERDLHGAMSQLEGLKGLKHGTIVVSCLQYFGQHHMTEFIADFQREYPRIAFTVITGSSAEVVSHVAHDTAELGVCFDPHRGTAVERAQAIPLRFGAVVPAGHALAQRRRVRLRECLTFPLVLPVAGMESRIFADQLGLSRWPEHIVSAQTNSFGMLVELIKAGVGIGFMADFDAALEVERGTLVFLPLLDPGVPTPHLCVITKAGRTLPFATALILQRLGMHLERLVSRWTIVSR